MDFTGLRTCLGTDFQLLRAAVAATDPAAPVPSCPDWTVADLAHHVARVYLHKAESVRQGVEPKPWPPTARELGPDPVSALDRQYAALLAQFDAHSPADHAPTWHAPDQTVGFWIRRMALETVVHRVDAELAAGSPISGISPIPEDLAVDGIDEILSLFVASASVVYREEFGELLDAPDDRPVALIAGDHAWSIRATKDGVLVARIAAAAGPDAAATVTGTPQQLLLWLWNRADDSVASLGGDFGLLGQFQALRTLGTQ